MNKTTIKKIPASIMLTETTNERLKAIVAETSISKIALIERAIIRLLDTIEEKGIGVIWEQV